jgi:hypothetical protein
VGTKLAAFDKIICIANFEFGDTLFLKVMPNCPKSQAMSIHKIQQVP